ncbi:immunoglobulin alpha-2 heavy chain-like [Alligator sinensis]|uniref:immunoglobulin alpha-2 heavy chain-like n=1 Tax=Alligator sinensis TaxID=38654 RepID=UPI000D7200B8|nr:immunoglobulin alpha-2 heavy chain-like [Alligator sinensis]
MELNVSLGGMCRSWVVRACTWLLGAQFHLHQPQRFLFVDVNGVAEIHCFSREDLAGGANVLWYLRRVGEDLKCIKDCGDDKNGHKFACKHQIRNTTLEIRNIQKKESGIYYCARAATRSLTFGNGTTVIVGDSFTHSSSVLLLGPIAGENGAKEPAHLACVIWGVSNLVQGSWRVPGEEPAQGRPHSLEVSNGSLTLIHHISVPWASWASGVAATCEVTFNSSGSSVTRHAVYSASPSAPCVILPVVAAGSALLLVTVPLSLIWIHCPPRWGSWPREPAPCISQQNEENGEAVYTELSTQHQETYENLKWNYN